MIPLKDVKRHARQKEFEELFYLGPKELLLKTYSASLEYTLGKLWISTSAVCFSASSHTRMTFPFFEIKEIRSTGWRSVSLVLIDENVHELSGLWHKDEALSLLNSLWWNSRPSRLTPRKDNTNTNQNRSGRVTPTPPVSMDMEDLVVVAQTSQREGSERKPPASPVELVHKTLDELDDVADMLLVSTPTRPHGTSGQGSSVGSSGGSSGGGGLEGSSGGSSQGAADDGGGVVKVDQYGFALEGSEEAYASFIGPYLKSQDRMRQRWLTFMQKRDAEDDWFAPNIREELETLLCKGLPLELRPHIYFRVSGARKKRSMAEQGYYVRLKQEAIRRAPRTDWGHAVEKDVLRTFPYHPDFAENTGTLLEPLRNVLFAYGLRNSSVGYCQGMNFVCGAFLLIFRDVRNEEEREEKVFWIMCSLVEDLLPAYYTSDMVGSIVDQSVLAFFCEARMPKLYAQFKALEYPISLVLVKWMNCLFLLNAPTETAFRIIDVTMLLGSDALIEFSLGFLSTFQNKLCQCQDLHEISRVMDQLLSNFYPIPVNVERMQSFIGQIDRRELNAKRHRVFEAAETRLREYSTTRTMDRLRQLGSFEEDELVAMHAHWSAMWQEAKHKEGIDFETFSRAVVAEIAPAWQKEPQLLKLLFDHVNKSRTGVVSLPEWISLIESLGSKRGKMQLLYGMCGGKGDPAKTAQVMAYLVLCWMDREITDEEMTIVLRTDSVYDPERFVRMIKTNFRRVFTEMTALTFARTTSKE